MRASLLRSLTIGWMALLSAGLGWVIWRQSAPAPRTAKFDEISAQRLSIVERDGKPRVVISNRDRMPGAFWRGKETAHRSHGGGGFLFFDDDGTEAGGMGFSSGRTGGRFGAESNMNFDQYEQDSTLQLVYQDDNGQRVAGVRVKDRPNQSVGPALELIDQLAHARPAERTALQAKLVAEERKLVAGHADRFFAGKQLDDSVVRLADKKGRTRLLMKVDGAGVPSIDFYDEAGRVTRKITGS